MPQSYCIVRETQASGEYCAECIYISGLLKFSFAGLRCFCESQNNENIEEVSHDIQFVRRFSFGMAPNMSGEIHYRYYGENATTLYQVMRLVNITVR